MGISEGSPFTRVEPKNRWGYFHLHLYDEDSGRMYHTAMAIIEKAPTLLGNHDTTRVGIGEMRWVEDPEMETV